MYVRYFTDIPEPRNGFKALITTSSIPLPLFNYLLNSVIVYHYPFIDDCGGIKREPRGGVISSPNFPYTYDTESHFCSWWIIAPTSYRGIRLQFQNFELPGGKNCSEDDHITIYEKLPGNFYNGNLFFAVFDETFCKIIGYNIQYHFFF